MLREFTDVVIHSVRGGMRIWLVLLGLPSAHYDTIYSILGTDEVHDAYLVAHASKYFLFTCPWQSVLVVAGAFKRAEPDLAEDALLMRALRDFNIPKIVREDEVVFFGLLGKKPIETSHLLLLLWYAEAYDDVRFGWDLLRWSITTAHTIVSL